MKNGKCSVCKLVALLAGVGALNWGLVALFDLDLVRLALGGIPALAKIVYVLVGVAGLLLLLWLVKACPKCCSSGEGKTGGKQGE